MRTLSLNRRGEHGEAEARRFPHHTKDKGGVMAVGKTPEEYRFERNKKAAEDLLVHYFKTVWIKAGLGWESDNDSEVRGIVSAIFDTIADDRR
jgi:hypothetical protein